MVIFSHSISPRLSYIAAFLSEELIAGSARITTSQEEFRSFSGIRINYSNQPVSDSEIWIHPQGLLFESGIRDQPIACIKLNGLPAFFQSGGDLGFDLLSATFYLLSRYEEYLPHKKDEYGRYAHKNALAYREGFLDRPLVNIWLEELKRLIIRKFNSLHLVNKAFSFLPTYDIDIAWSYRNKGLMRNAVGLIRDLFSGRLHAFLDRIRVQSSSATDPYDSYRWMDKLHEDYQLSPYYFFLVAAERGKYDKNISPANKALRQLIAEHVEKYEIGIHPSWQSGDDPSLIKNEKRQLEQISGKNIRHSRQHFIRFTLPQTFRLLIESGIEADHSMGYGSINGFRASVASPHYWYDLEMEEQTRLRLYPFCFMEANSFYEQKQSAEQTYQEMMHYYEQVKAVDGMLIMIWHNSFLGTDKIHKGWREIYSRFIQHASGE